MEPVQVDLRALTTLGPNLYAVGNAAFRRLVDDAHARARENVSGGPAAHSMGRVISRRGALRESIKKGPYIQMGPGRAGEQRIYTNIIYGRVHEFGAVIAAKRGPYLRFRLWLPADTSAPSGPWRVARRVEIPARPYLGPAVNEAVRHWPQYVAEAIAYIMGGRR